MAEPLPPLEPVLSQPAVVEPFDPFPVRPIQFGEAEISCFDLPALNWALGQPGTIEFYYSKRKYCGNVLNNGTLKELRINNTEGQVLIIQPEQRRGFLEHQNQIQEIDVSQSHYFNLVRSALMALELAEKTQTIQTQRQLLAVQQQEIEQLKQQIVQLQEQVEAGSAAVQPVPKTWIAVPPVEPAPIDLSAEPDAAPEADPALETNPVEPEAIAHLEPAMPEPELESAELSEAAEWAAPDETAPLEPVVLPSDPKQRLMVELGPLVWQRLDSRSQKDLMAAYKKQDEAEIDYSDAGLRLCSVIEREVVQPFFKELHQFLLEHNEPCEIGGITLRARKKYTLGMLPPLLATEWQSFQDDRLTQDTPADAASLYTTVATPVEPDDQDTVQVFLAQWEHALGFWLQAPTAASRLAQVDKLLTLAADAENPLYDWQFRCLHLLIIGNLQQQGILSQIYGTA